MEAILAEMVEGVIVVDPQGRLQLANDAARRILKRWRMKVRGFRTKISPACSSGSIVSRNRAPAIRAAPASASRS
jgi:sensor histidine kinase regulating citrate/malate metabolism